MYPHKAAETMANIYVFVVSSLGLVTPVPGFGPKPSVTVRTAAFDVSEPRVLYATQRY